MTLGNRVCTTRLPFRRFVLPCEPVIGGRVVAGRDISRRLVLITIGLAAAGVVVSSCGTGPPARGEQRAPDGYPVHDERPSHDAPESSADQRPEEPERGDDPTDDSPDNPMIESERDPHSVATAALPGASNPVSRPDSAARGRYHDAEIRAIEHRAAGEYFDAISEYSLAVRAAIDDKAPAEVVDRLATVLEATIREISLTKRTDNLTGVVRRPVEDAFVLEVSTPRGAFVSVPITVAYREARPDGRTAVRTASLQTDAAGRVEFVPPSLAVPGRETVTMVLDLSSYIAPVTGVETDDAVVARIGGVAAEKRATFVYIVESRAREIRTSVAVVETDIAGNPLATDMTANAMTQLLIGEGFTMTSGTVDARPARNLTGEDAARFLRTAVDPDVQRVVFGTVKITGFEEDNGFVVTVSGEVSMIELETGATVSRVSATQRSRGQSSSAAISAAFRAIGIRFGQDIVAAFR